jgi:hypothetical protein
MWGVRASSALMPSQARRVQIMTNHTVLASQIRATNQKGITGPSSLIKYLLHIRLETAE